MKTYLNLAVWGGVLMILGFGAPLIDVQGVTWFVYIGGAIILWALIAAFRPTDHGPFGHIFKNCGLLIKDDDGNVKLPKVRRQTNTDNGYECELLMPIGLCCEDLQKKKQAVKEALKATDVEFEYKREFVLMRVIE